MNLFFSILFLIAVCRAADDYEFPESFMFGVSTGSYQIEGAWDEDGKGENIWDWFTHTYPNRISDGSNGNVACDAYHKTKEDVQLLKSLNVSLYRFSISWARVLPTGQINNINQEGVDYYNNLINELQDNGITPLVTMYHWDLPIALHQLGGWPNPALANIFVEYADKLFEWYGDRVKYWLTFNEPGQVCQFGYSVGVLAPGYAQAGIGGYLCAHTLLRAHGMAYRLYEEKYKSTQEGKVGISIHAVWTQANSESEEDEAAAEGFLQYHFGLYAHPIFIGDYPSDIKTRIATLSEQESYPRSRLPSLSSADIQMIKGSADFLGLNHYTTYVCMPEQDDLVATLPGIDADSLVYCYQPDDWPAAASRWLRVAPWGLRNILNWINLMYNNPEVIITENGYSDTTGDLRDCERIDYYNEYLTEVLNAIHVDGCNVIGYATWSFLDNFEWISGYTEKFGIYHVDFDDDERTRTPKMSSYVYKNIIATRKINESYTPEGFAQCSATSFILSNLNKLLLASVLVYLFLK